MKKHTKAVEIILSLIITIIMAMTMLATQDANVLGPMSGALLIGFSAFLGIDMAKMIKETKALPPGRYKDMNTGRYIFSSIIFFALFILAFAVGKIHSVPMSATLAVFGSGSILMISFIIGGVGGNKLVTGDKKEQGA